MKKIIFSLLSFFVLASNLSAQKITSANSGFDKIESTGDYIFSYQNTPYNPNVPFFTRINPNAESGYPAFYGMSMSDLYYASSNTLYATIELIKVDAEKLTVNTTKEYAKTPYVVIYALDGEESWNTPYKKDGNEIQETQQIFVFDTEAPAQKFVEELKIFVKVSQLYRKEAWKLRQPLGADVDATITENGKKRIKVLEQAEALIAGKKYTQLEIILASEKYEQYEQNISNLIQYDIKTEKYILEDNAPKDAAKQIYDNLEKIRTIRKTFQTKYKTFEENYYPSRDKGDWRITKCLNKVNARGGYATSLPATLAEFEQTASKIQEEKQQANKNLENANVIDATGNSPLMNAIKAKDTEKAIILIKNGADVAYKNPKNNISTLKMAIEEGNVSIIKLIMQSEAMSRPQSYQTRVEVNIEEEIMFAIKKNNTEIAQAVINSGARRGIYIADENGYYPAMIAYRAGNLALCQSLLKTDSYQYEAQSKNEGMTLLMMAIEKNDLNAIKELNFFDREKKLEEMNKDGYTALMIATEKGHTEIVKLALEKGYRQAWSFKSTQGKMKGKNAIDVAKNREIKKLITPK